MYICISRFFKFAPVLYRSACQLTEVAKLHRESPNKSVSTLFQSSSLPQDLYILADSVLRLFGRKIGRSELGQISKRSTRTIKRKRKKKIILLDVYTDFYGKAVLVSYLFFQLCLYIIALCYITTIVEIFIVWQILQKV